MGSCDVWAFCIEFDWIGITAKAGSASPVQEARTSNEIDADQ